MTVDELYNLLLKNLVHQPTPSQANAGYTLSRFLLSEKQNCALVIQGYAGTGKTTLLSSLVNSLSALNQKTILLAPTGRAAKVLSNYSKEPATTIHKKIYFKQSLPGGGFAFVPGINKHKFTLFIIDESSMISDSTESSADSFLTRNLLDDVFDYVFSGTGCRLLLVGDNAQLPPVGAEKSPALDIEYLKQKFTTTIASAQLTDVVRQAENSGILVNATYLRNFKLSKQNKYPIFDVQKFNDIVQLEGSNLQDELEWAYDNYGAEGTILITRSNKTANKYNQQIRSRIRGMEGEIAVGDYLMVVKNNYFWLPENENANFIANGDTILVKRILGFEEMYGMHFANLTISLIDIDKDKEYDVKVILETIQSEEPALGYTKQKQLFEKISEDFAEIKNKKKRNQEVFKSPYLNALQIKFAYAITCHKAQGGQWPIVFIDQGYVTEEMIDVSFLRWLYTAVTRATTKLYLVNFNKQFFPAIEE
jgi:exodeoxyribonuclease V